MKAMINEIMETIKNIVKRLLGLETAQKNTVKRLTTLETALDSITKRLSALEKGVKTTSKNSTKTNAKKTTKKEVYYYDITKSDKVNKRNLKSLESSYHYNKERYGKTFKENFKTFKDFKKSLDDLGSIKTRDRVYYSQREYDKLKGATK